jgi:hypothetical protein
MLTGIHDAGHEMTEDNYDIEQVHKVFITDHLTVDVLSRSKSLIYRDQENILNRLIASQHHYLRRYMYSLYTSITRFDGIGGSIGLFGIPMRDRAVYGGQQTNSIGWKSGNNIEEQDKGNVL